MTSPVCAPSPRPVDTEGSVSDRMLRNMITFLLMSIAIYFAIAIALIATQRPQVLNGEGGLAFSSVVQSVPPQDALEHTHFVTPTAFPIH